MSQNLSPASQLKVKHAVRLTAIWRTTASGPDRLRRIAAAAFAPARRQAGRQQPNSVDHLGRVLGTNQDQGAPSRLANALRHNHIGKPRCCPTPASTVVIAALKLPPE